MRILVVEDDTPTAQAIAALLTGQNYAVEIAPDRVSALELLDAFPFDLILLDVVMPDGNGIELCRKVRADGHQMPILMLTGRDTGHDKAQGLDAGADDYVVKPFDPEELSARIRALLRRGSVAGQPVLEWGPLRLDPSSCEVSFGSQMLTLTPKEYALLELFLRNSRRVFSCGVILEQIWSFEEMPGEEAVRTHIKGLRQKLKAKGAPADFVETVYGIGYRLKPLETAETSTEVDKPSEAVQQKTLNAIAQLWEKFKGQVQGQVHVVEQAVTALLNGTLEEALRQQAIQDAHTLAGSLGTFGFPEASKHARTLEHWLQDKTAGSTRKAVQMAELVRSIQNDIDAPQASATPVSQPAPTPDPAPSTPPQERLMVVDDDPAMLATVKTLLEPWGLHVTTLPDPRQFWNTLEAATPSLLILDIQMPYRNGIELCQEVREHDRWGGLPIMILTAHQDAETVNQVFAAGADDFVSKPIVGPELVSRILHRLERVRLLRRFSEAPVAEPKTQGRHSEEEFHQLVDGIKDYGIYMLDATGHIISWNSGAERIKGYSPAVILGQFLGRLYLPEEVATGKPEQDLAIARTEGRCEFLGWRQRQDGTCFWGDVVITSVWNPDQTLRGYAVVTRDVTDRKQMDEALQRSRDKLEVRVAERTAELVGVNERLRRELEERKRAQEALRVSQARFAGILDIADDAIISVDACQRITLFNQGAEKIFGYTAQEVRDQSLSVLLPQRYAAVHQGHVKDFGQAHNNARRMGERREIYGRRKDGTEFPAEASISKFEVGGEVVYTVILRDITLRKQAEEALANLSHENELILNSVGEGICGLDLEGRITFINPAATNLLGYTRDELIGQSIQVILENAKESANRDSDGPSTIDVFLYNGAAQAKRDTFWCKDGTAVPVEYVSTPIQEQEIVGSVITFKDITERQVVERMKDEFISVVSHELRTPLTSIHGSLGMLASGLLATDPSTSKRLLDIAVASTERLVRLINDILDVERIESGKVTMQLQACDAKELVQRAADALQPMAEKSEITLQVQAEPITFQADPDRILQTLTNLLSNAIKFSPAHSHVWITATLDQGSELQPDASNIQAEGLFATILRKSANLLNPPHVLFSVADQGRGVPLDKQETIFERFQQVDASDSRNQDGTGLGLAICRNIVQQHGGHIFVDSILGKGSTFYFTIPLRSPNQEAPTD
ncbi:PAS domain S-box protein [Leptolyngbya sp. FACHB-16]|uniref:PAS domain S-box protein n=1 Tax=unclassified Leptolyngbya TaxID=2650499 RepID=UPI001683846C|nr:PAS domain S-box protein [Leptolyngbya sp. FACHB-16]MBD2155214.1 PAS domain S-box protein [Leptolyngbya sp. FACHB-16]